MKTLIITVKNAAAAKAVASYAKSQDALAVVETHNDDSTAEMVRKIAEAETDVRRGRLYRTDEAKVLVKEAIAQWLKP